MAGRSDYAKLTNEQRAKMRELRREHGLSVPDIARRFGVSTECVYHTLKGATNATA